MGKFTEITVQAMPSTTKFFHLDGQIRTPLNRPEDVKPFLAKPHHWKPGYSAAELAKSWIGADGFPPEVQNVIEADRVFQGIRLIKGLFEHKTDLQTPGRDSQTDLLLHAQAQSGTVVIGVEGKRDESFGPLVGKWLAKGGRRRERLASLCSVLGLDPESCPDLRYQLFHRTVATLYEAEAASAAQAMLLVHSFSPSRTGFGDFQQFTAKLGLKVEDPNSVTDSTQLHGTTMRFAWVSDPKPIQAEI